MNLNIPRLVFNMILLLAIQLVLLDSISIGGWADPKIYVVSFLAFPVFFSKHLLILIAFIIGLCMDIMMGTLGIHVTACILTAYIRPHVLAFLKTKDGYNNIDIPSIKLHGLSWYIAFLSLTILPFHLFLFFFEKFSLQHFFWTFFRSLVCGSIAIVLILIIHVVFQSKRLKDDRF